MNLYMRQKQTHSQREQVFDCQGADVLGEGWNRSLELADANYYTQNVYNNTFIITITRSYCITHRTIFNIPG